MRGLFGQSSLSSACECTFLCFISSTAQPLGIQWSSPADCELVRTSTSERVSPFSSGEASVCRSCRDTPTPIANLKEKKTSPFFCAVGFGLNGDSNKEEKESSSSSPEWFLVPENVSGCDRKGHPYMYPPWKTQTLRLQRPLDHGA